MPFLDDLRPHSAACAFCVDSPLLQLELVRLSSMFEQMQDNLPNRFRRRNAIEECVHSLGIINVDQLQRERDVEKFRRAWFSVSTLSRLTFNFFFFFFGFISFRAESISRTIFVDLV